MSARAYGTAVETTDGAEISTVAPMTVAETSRAAAQAVRLSISNGELHDAHYVVNSLRYSCLGDKPPFNGIRGLQTSSKNVDHINFGRPVSPRLSAHALLHGLIRLGLTARAYRVAYAMMDDGIKIRTATLEAIFHALLPRPYSSRLKDTSRYRLASSSDGPQILHLQPGIVSEPSTRYAVGLLIQARRQRQRRTQDMYQALINACLLQGEIIVGSLLFVMVVKDWQLRRTLAARLNCCSEDSDVSSQSLSEPVAVLRARFEHLRSEGIFPSKAAMGYILASIDATLSEDPQDESTQKEFQAALQALANLAVLLDNQQIPFREIAPLIRTLYRCPRVQNEVWIRQKNKAVRVKAYSYFHDVLKRLIDSLPSQRPDQLGKVMLPPLHRSAYNSLLHYALRHRLSPSLANTVLNHMVTQRNPRLPDIVTYNILIRSGTLLRRPDIGEGALDTLRKRKENVRHGIMVEPSPKRNADFTSSRKGSPAHNSRFSRALRRLKTESLNLTSTSLLSCDSPLFADSFTLTAYISHLTSTGQPHVVADILFHVLPELAIVDHPSWGLMTDEERLTLHATSREACLSRAVVYGPHFFTVILNALCKAGKTGLAERVWLLAKEAERVSWIPDFRPDFKPWCLPVHAYTIMIQCYGAEARKGLLMRRAIGRRYDQFRSGDSSWEPRSKRQVRGWAHFILTRHQIASQNVSRHYNGQKTGIMLFRSMISGARAVYDALMSINRHHAFGRVQIPTPDARFFSAALDMFARQPSMYSRGIRTPRTRWRRKFRRAETLYARQGTISKHWTPFLQEVAEEMVEAGYCVPPAFRYIFVGRWTPGTLQLDERRQLERRPFAFPVVRQGTFRPHAASVFKSRGLPVGRRWRPRLRSRHSLIQAK
jgi:hypothetical protein